MVATFNELATWCLSTSRGQRIGTVVAGLMVLLCVMTFMSMVTGWRGDWQLTQSHRMPQQAVTLTNEETKLIAAIPDAHLFGRIDAIESLPITSLQLLLTGIIKTDQYASRAIISEAGKPGQIYVVGDVLSVGVKINAINDDSVILEYEGKLEKLPLVRTNLVFLDHPKSMW